MNAHNEHNFLRRRGWAIPLGITVALVSGCLLASFAIQRPSQALATGTQAAAETPSSSAENATGAATKSPTAEAFPIVFHLAGGKNPKGQTLVIKAGQTVSVTKLKIPKRKGYEFVGWYKNKARTKVAKRIRGVANESKRRIYAKWKVKTYDIAYKLKGGTFKGRYAQEYKIKRTTTLPTPYKQGYSFMGWRTKAAPSKVILSIPPTARGNKTFIASWRKRVLVAHRGLHSDAPENSIASIQSAAAKGFKEVEVDVRFTRDGAPVLVHDAAVKIRRANSVGVTRTQYIRVSKFRYERLQNATFAQDQSGVDGKNLATFEEAMEACKTYGVTATVHLKTNQISQLETLMVIAKNYRMKKKIRWFSTDLTALRHVRALDSDASVCYSHKFTEKAIADAMEFSKHGDTMISTNYNQVTKNGLTRCKAVGVPVRVWAFKNETKIKGIDPYIASILIDGIKGKSVPNLVTV